MTNTFQKTLENLPEIFIQNSSAIAARLVSRMQRQMETDVAALNTGYLMLLLKMSSSDLVVEFEKVLRAAMARARSEVNGSGFSFEFSIAGEIDSSMLESDRAFQSLQAKSRSCGALSLAAFSPQALLKCVNEAMAGARISETDIQALAPFVRQALNTELVAIYQKLINL
ncbi:hypothetical protein [Rhodoferax aquaticus]|uniref:Uncharacterized protein n=1 Tax=Rhodoferax aquaticus TaxID=2527691 RepID=A0A515EJP2_9BURK|nr:hypothetical protein [Rhodoferax aquaticus]QDL52894.1 hypothetical protein EXZ61_01170 [Rhodoferax aquaticus]